MPHCEWTKFLLEGKIPSCMGPTFIGEKIGQPHHQDEYSYREQLLIRVVRSDTSHLIVYGSNSGYTIFFHLCSLSSYLCVLASFQFKWDVFS